MDAVIGSRTWFSEKLGVWVEFWTTAYVMVECRTLWEW